MKSKNKLSHITAVGVQPSSPVRAELMIEPDVDFLSTVITLQPNYYDAFARRTARLRQVSARDYLKSNDTRYSNLMCVEMPLPNEIASKLTLEVENSPASAAVCLFHAAQSACVAPLHYDWDHQWVLHVCLTGSKTLYFIPPDAGWLLSPIINTSTICLPRLSRIDREDLLQRLGGLEVKLRPREAVLFPSMWWHAVRYEAPSAALSIRFGGDATLRPFAALPRSFWLQRLVWAFFKQKHRFPPEYLVRCLSAFLKQGSWTDRYRRVNATYRAILKELRQPYGTEYLTSDEFNPEIALAADELKELYSLNARGHNPRLTAESIDDVRAYLFQNVDQVPYKTQRALAEYALEKRQGLAPRRGLIALHPKPGLRGVKARRHNAEH